jgi:hypothetical protein
MTSQTWEPGEVTAIAVLKSGMFDGIQQTWRRQMSQAAFSWLAESSRKRVFTISRNSDISMM